MIPQLGIDVLVRLTNQLTAPLRNAEETVAKASERMNRSLQLSLKLGAAGTAASGVAWGAERMISGFTDSIRAVEQAKGELATLGVQDLDAVVQRGLDMQTQLAGVTADAFVRASYDIKSGISSLTDEGVAEMTASAMLVAKATRGQAEQMTSLFATSYGIFKDQYAMMTDADFGNMFGAALSASVQQFKTDGAAMQQAIESAGAGAVNLGMDMTEQLALLGMMQQQMAAGEAGTALRAFATNAAKAHEAFADLSSESGNPVRVRVLDENGQMRAMPDILADLQARYGETLDAFEAAEIKEAFGTDEAMKMINALYGQEAAVRANAQALDDAAAQGQEFTAQMAAAADNNWDAAMVLMSQKMDVLYQKIGNSLLPVVERIVPYFDAFIERAFTWIDANPGLIAGIGGVVAGLGLVAAVIAPVLLGASALVSTWGTMTFGLVKVATALPLVGKALLFIGRALMANPIGLAVAAIAGAAYLIYEYWEPISAFFGDLWDSVTGYFQGAWDGIAGWFSGLWDRIRSGAVYGWEIIKGLFLNYTPAGLIYTHWESISGWFGGLWENVRAGAENGWLLLKILFLNYHPAAIIYNHWGQITEWFGTLWDNVKTKFTEKWEAIKAEVATWPAEMRAYGSDLIQSLIDGIKTKFAAMAQAVQDAMAYLNPFSSVPVTVDVQTQGGTSAPPMYYRGAYADRTAVQRRATGGRFNPGWLLTGEEGAELEYRTEGGYIAHHGALKGMMAMAERTRELMQGVGDAGTPGGFDVPALATVAAAGNAGLAQGNVTFAPQYNIPLSFAPGVDVEEVRETVREELMEAEERLRADMRGNLYD